MIGEFDLAGTLPQAGRADDEHDVPVAWCSCDGRPRLVVGSAGSSRLRGAVMQIVVNVLGARPRRRERDRRAARAPRGRRAPPRAAARGRRRAVRGRAWNERNLFFGGVSAVERLPDGTLGAAGDPRRGGARARRPSMNPPNRDWAAASASADSESVSYHVDSHAGRVLGPGRALGRALARCSSSSRSRVVGLLPFVLARAFERLVRGLRSDRRPARGHLLGRGVGQRPHGARAQGTKRRGRGRRTPSRDSGGSATSCSTTSRSRARGTSTTSSPGRTASTSSRRSSRSYLPVHLKKAKRQAAKLSDELGVPVTPVLCVASSESGPYRHVGVYVVGFDACSRGFGSRATRPSSSTAWRASRRSSEPCGCDTP